VNTFFCPRRLDYLSWGGYSPIFEPERQGEDTWREREGALHCSYCGSLPPARLFELIESEAAQLGPTDKGYKLYVEEWGDKEKPCWECHGEGATHKTAANPEGVECFVCFGAKHIPTGPRHKFYFQHFSQEDRQRFIELHNNGKIDYGYPGYLYSRPYFTKSDRKA